MNHNYIEAEVAELSERMTVAELRRVLIELRREIVRRSATAPERNNLAVPKPVAWRRPAVKGIRLIQNKDQG